MEHPECKEKGAPTVPAPALLDDSRSRECRHPAQRSCQLVDQLCNNLDIRPFESLVLPEIQRQRQAGYRSKAIQKKRYTNLDPILVDIKLGRKHGEGI